MWEALAPKTMNQSPERDAQRHASHERHAIADHRQSALEHKKIAEHVSNSPRATGQRSVMAMISDSSRHVIQKYGALGPGVPGNVALPVATVLTHGTTVQNFLDPHGGHQPTPDAPAWFAIGSRFSAHAGSRFNTPTTYLHNYSVTNGLNLIAFDDVGDLSQYLVNNGHGAVNVNGTAEANLVLALNPVIDGYMLDRDAVRGEPEYILFNAGIAKLQSMFTSSLDVRVPTSTAYDDLDTSSRTRLVGNGQVIHTSSRLDLSDFRTEADDKLTGRPRAQSL